jgi:hypothetical protein
MERLPNELLVKVFVLLDQQEKVECMLVCHDFARLIQASCLFNTIQLSEMSNFVNLIARSSRSQGAQVECLILNFYLEGDLHYILSFFPNIRVFYVLGCHNLVFQQTPHKTNNNRHLENMAETFSHDLTCHLLASCLTFTKLKTLDIKASKHDVSANTVISLLDHAPNLSDLAMESFTVCFEHLELLHSTLFSLHSIKLFSSVLTDSENTLQLDDMNQIEPALSVRVFCLETAGSACQLQQKWIHYINSKYINLSKLTLKYPTLENSQLEWQSQRAFINDHFGPQLKCLTLKLNNCGPDLFCVLDDCKCQIEYLDINLELQQNTLLDALLRSNQVEYIRTLKLTEAISDLEWLKELPGLRDLTLKGSRRLHLNKLLDICANTLEALVISSSHAIIIEYSHCRAYSSIKRLGFFYESLPHRMDHFITKAFPNLCHLRLIHCGLKTFNLANHRLSFLEIAEGVLFKDTFLLLITEKETKLYTANQYYSHYQHLRQQNIQNIPAYLNAKSTIIYEMDENTPMPTVVFQCAHVDTLYVLR